MDLTPQPSAGGGSGIAEQLERFKEKYALIQEKITGPMELVEIHYRKESNHPDAISKGRPAMVDKMVFTFGVLDDSGELLVCAQEKKPFAVERSVAVPKPPRGTDAKSLEFFEKSGFYKILLDMGYQLKPEDLKPFDENNLLGIRIDGIAKVEERVAKTTNKPYKVAKLVDIDPPKKKADKDRNAEIFSKTFG